MSDHADAVQIDTDRVNELARSLSQQADGLASGAGGVPRTAPAIPYDWFDLVPKVVALDEEREAFDHRLASFLRDQGNAAAEQITRATAADR